MSENPMTTATKTERNDIELNPTGEVGCKAAKGYMVFEGIEPKKYSTTMSTRHTDLSVPVGDPGCSDFCHSSLQG